MRRRDTTPHNGPLFGQTATVRVTPRPNMTPLRATLVTRNGTIEQRFAEWLRVNDNLVREIVRLALEAKAAGVDRYGMKALFEVVRWNHRIRARADGFKLNNDYTAPLARHLMREVPELDGFFETRSKAT